MRSLYITNNKLIQICQSLYRLVPPNNNVIHSHFLKYYKVIAVIIFSDQ